MENEEKTAISLIIDSDIEDELKNSFLKYSLSVITSRALPDVKDGLKPIHRRIIYAMYEIGLLPNKPFKKSAKIVGEVIAKYHPHGDKSVYDTLVRMGQNFTYRYPIIFPQGNFGSIDGDNPAAMRYTEAKMTKYALELTNDIEYETIKFINNYDDSEKEPTVIPSKLPNLLLNGSDGIAVGMTTSIPPHNLNEVVDATIHVIKNPNCEISEIIDIIKGPDFPGGAYILHNKSLENIYYQGYGSVTIRSKWFIVDDKKNKSKQIIITEIPYFVNKANLVMQIAEIAEKKTITGVKDIRDESSRKGIRIVIEVDEMINTDVLLNNLYKHTQLQTYYHAKMLALVDGKPQENLNIKAIIIHYIDHQVDITKKKIKFLLNKSLKKEEILEGQKKAIEIIDEIIKVIKKSSSTKESLDKLMKNFDFTLLQAKSILEMKLQRLSSIELKLIIEELEKQRKLIAKYKEILSDKENILQYIINELEDAKRKYGDERRSEIILFDEHIKNTEIVKSEDCVLLFTKNNYIKLLKLDEFRTQHRAGKGIRGTSLYKDDIIQDILYCDRLDSLLLFTNLGRVYKLNAFEIPTYSRNAKGTPVVNIIPSIETNNEKIISILKVNALNKNEILLFLTKKGIIKKTSLNNFKKVQKNGKLAINISKHSDAILNVIKTSYSSEYVIGTDIGNILVAKVNELRSSGRLSYGVRGIKTISQKPISLSDSTAGEYVFCISENGYGKATLLSKFRKTKRGGKGTRGLKISEKSGKLVYLACVNKTEDILVTTHNGQIIRINLSNLRALNRATTGVKIISLAKNDKINSITVIPMIKQDVRKKYSICII